MLLFNYYLGVLYARNTKLNNYLMKLIKILNFGLLMLSSLVMGYIFNDNIGYNRLVKEKNIDKLITAKPNSTNSEDTDSDEKSNKSIDKKGAR